VDFYIYMRAKVKKFDRNKRPGLQKLL